MAAHARLKNGFTEDEKCHNLMSWLNWFCNKVMHPKDGNGTEISADLDQTVSLALNWSVPKLVTLQ